MPKQNRKVTKRHIARLHQLAIEARDQSYSPYSHFKVGASVLFDDGAVASGTNIENASYGATVCAERVAIWSGIKENKKRKLLAVCVVTDQKETWPPCGMCLQVISEFARPDTLIILGNLHQVQAQYFLTELMAKPFSPLYLQSKSNYSGK